MSVKTEIWYRKDEYDAVVDELNRYKHALWEANGYRILAGLEPVKLDYPQSEMPPQPTGDYTDSIDVPENPGQCNCGSPYGPHEPECKVFVECAQTKGEF